MVCGDRHLYKCRILCYMPITFIYDGDNHRASFIRCVNFRSLLTRVQIVKFRIFQSRHAATFSSFSFLRIVTLCVFLYCLMICFSASSHFAFVASSHAVLVHNKLITAMRFSHLSASTHANTFCLLPSQLSSGVLPPYFAISALVCLDFAVHLLSSVI